MHVIFGVTSHSGTVRRRSRELLIGVTLLALGHAIVEPEKRPFRVVGVVESHRLPNAGLVATIAFVAQRPEVERVVVAANAALRRRASVFIVDVTLHAVDRLVPFVERPGPAQTVHGLHTSCTDLLRTFHLVTLETCLHALAVAHHRLALGLVGEVVVVHVLVLMAAHAALAVVCGGAELFELVGLVASVTTAARCIRMLAPKGKLGAFGVVEAIGLP